MSMLLSVILCLSPAWTEPVRYDRITLLDGQIVTGQVVEEQDARLLIQVTRMGGRVRYTREVAKAHIARREYIEVRQTTAPGPEPATPFDPAAPGTEHDPVAAAVRAFQEWSIRNVEDASRRLVRLINRCTPEQLQRVDELARRDYDISLAEFAAVVHLEYSLLRADEGHFRLYFATPYTAEASYHLLGNTLRSALAERTPPSAGPAARSDSVLQWLDRPRSFDGDGGTAYAFAQHVSRVLGMNRELSRLAQALHRPKEELKQLNEQHRLLRDLLQAVRARQRRIQPTP